MVLKSRQPSQCIPCEMWIKPEDRESHLKSHLHKVNAYKYSLSSNESELLREKEGVRTVCDSTNESDAIVNIRCTRNQRVQVDFRIISELFDVLFETAFLLENTNLLSIIYPDSRKLPTTIQKGGSFSMKLSAISVDATNRVIPLAMKFSRSRLKPFDIVRYIRISCIDETICSIENSSVTQKFLQVPSLPDADKVVLMQQKRLPAFSFIRRPEPPSSSEETSGAVQDMLSGIEDDSAFDSAFSQTRSLIGKEVPLRFYKPPEFLKKLHILGLRESETMDKDLRDFYLLVKKHLDLGIDPKKPENYDKYFQMLLYCEDIQQEADIRKYDMTGVSLKPFEDDPDRFELEVEGLEEGRPSLLRMDKIYVRFDQESVEYEGFISTVKLSSIEIVMTGQFVKMYFKRALGNGMQGTEEDLENLLFGVRFSVNRKPLRCMHRALEQVEQHFKNRSPINKVIMPENYWPAVPAVPENFGRLDLFNKNIENNLEQLCAVRNILLGLHRPAPYIVFGPPGTGKTTTIAEAILQVYKNVKESHILICTPSNPAANVIADKLIKSGVIEEHDLFRLFSASCSKAKVLPSLIAVSNWDPDSEEPVPVDMSELLSRRILIVTLACSGSYV